MPWKYKILAAATRFLTTSIPAAILRSSTLLAVDETGKIPPGNNRDNDTWAQKRRAKPEIKLTPGKGTQDLNCSISDLIDQVVKSNKVGCCCNHFLLPLPKHDRWTVVKATFDSAIRHIFAATSLLDRHEYNKYNCSKTGCKGHDTITSEHPVHVAVLTLQGLA